MPTASYFFNAISKTKDSDQFTQGEIDKDYKPYVVNRMVAGYRDLVLLAEEMNVCHNIAKEHQLAFYMATVPKKFRRTTWSAKKKDVDLEVIMRYYNINQEKADPYLQILSRKQIDELDNRLDEGGKQ